MKNQTKPYLKTKEDSRLILQSKTKSTSSGDHMPHDTCHLIIQGCCHITHATSPSKIAATSHMPPHYPRLAPKRRKGEFEIELATTSSTTSSTLHGTPHIFLHNFFSMIFGVV